MLFDANLQFISAKERSESESVVPIHSVFQYFDVIFHALNENRNSRGEQGNKTLFHAVLIAAQMPAH